MTPYTPYLNSCGCCEGILAETPIQVYNRPGLKAIAYRVGTHPQFKRSLQAGLSASRQPALQQLTTRDNDDFTIALLDAWATVSDVLTFYQERIANESYLKTATERLSILELARLIGYELRPGVAARTYMAFTIEDTPGALSPVLLAGISKNIRVDLPPVSIDTGVKVQSIPGPGEQAQIFENTEKIEARAEWNAIRPRLYQPQQLKINNDIVVLKGTVNDLHKGDIVLIRNLGIAKMRKILEVKIDEQAKTTRVEFITGAALPKYSESSAALTGNINEFKTKVDLDQNAIKTIIGKIWKQEDLSALIRIEDWSEEDLRAGITNALANNKSLPEKGFFIFRKQTFVFGYNAAKQVTYTDKNVPKLPQDWTEWNLSETPDRIYLDSAYEDVLPESFIGIQRSNESIETGKVVKINAANVRSRTAYGLSSKTTLLNISLKEPWWDSGARKPEELSAIRDVTIHAQSEQIELADLPIENVVQGKIVTLDRFYPGLKVGQKIIITGDRSDLQGVTASEFRTLQEVLVENGFTKLTFSDSLNYSYLRNSVTINANVALASHGETVEEVLGSGDASKSFQKFSLRQPPLTYISANTPEGSTTTLEIRVNEILWQEVPYFLDHGPKERIYITRLDDDGKTSVIFGDGKTGTRVPTGKENIKAKYRKGTGLGGLVKANQISQLITRPLGVKAAYNPFASTDAEDRESLDKARSNAPLAILTMGRIVSLQDYEDFARAFAGIDKSLATWTWCGQRRCIYVTVAGSNGATVSTDSMVDLLSAMQKAGDPNVSLKIEPYQPRFFRLTATLQIDPDYLTQKVSSAVEQKLREHFSFEARGFGQPVFFSEVMSAIHTVEGVISVDIDELYRTDKMVNTKSYLEANTPIPGDSKVFAAAELLTLDPAPINLNVIQ